MPADAPPPDLIPEAVAAAVSALGGILGRLMALSQERRMPLRWGLLWELPTAVGMGWIARGGAEYMHLTGFPAFAITIAGGYIGPGIISWAVQKLAGKLDNAGS